jgi:hypothetical protein
MISYVFPPRLHGEVSSGLPSMSGLHCKPEDSRGLVRNIAVDNCKRFTSVVYSGGDLNRFLK